MGNTSTSPLTPEYIRAVSNLTGFTKPQIQSLWKRFRFLDTEKKGYLTKQNFYEISDLQKNPFCDRIIEAFLKERRDEGGLMGSKNLVVTFEDFVRVFARFRPPNTGSSQSRLNTREEKLKFLFNLYDVDCSGSLCREDLTSVLTLMIGGTVTLDQIDLIADRLIGEADENVDEEISFEEFCEALKKIDIEKKFSLVFLQ